MHKLLQNKSRTVLDQLFCTDLTTNALSVSSIYKVSSYLLSLLLFDMT